MYAVQGLPTEVPDWLIVLLLAGEWGTPPWAIEEQVADVWVERWQMWQGVKADERKRQERRSGGKGRNLL